ncbi:MAG TPA: TolC family protein [Pirellulales bacterium]|nr:TolC family protein [Pirellulales bacterium]
MIVAFALLALRTATAAGPPSRQRGYLRTARQTRPEQGTGSNDPPVPERSTWIPDPSANFRVEGQWTLDELTRYAIENNPIFPRAQARIQSSRAAAWQAGRWTNPRFDTNNPQILAGGPNRNRYSAGAQVDIPMGKKRLDRAAGFQQARENEFSALSDRYDVLTAVRRNFYAVLAQQQRIVVLRQLVAIATGTRDTARKRFEHEQSAEIDVLTLAIELSKAEAALRQAETLLVAQRRRLAAATGSPDLAIGPLRGELAGAPPSFDDAYVRQFVAERNVDVLNARTEVNRGRTLRRRAEIDPIPNLYTGPAAAWFPAASGQATQFWYNFQFNIPVWDHNQGNIQSARAYVRDAEAGVQIAQNSLILQAADVLSRHRAAVQRAERIKQAILPTARKNQRLVEKGYRAGLFDVTRVLQAQRALFEANDDYIDALEDVWSTAADLGNLLQLERFP